MEPGAAGRPDDWLTVEEVAAILRIDRHYVTGFIRLRQLKASNLGGRGSGARWRIRRRDLDRFMDSRAP